MDNRRFYICVNATIDTRVLEFPASTSYIQYWNEDDENIGCFLPVCWFIFAGNKSHFDLNFALGDEPRFVN